MIKTFRLDEFYNGYSLMTSINENKLEITLLYFSSAKNIRLISKDVPSIKSFSNRILSKYQIQP